MNSSVDKAPDEKIGKDNGKTRTTPKNHREAFDSFFTVVNSKKSTQEEKNKAKDNLRKQTFYMQRGFTEVDAPSDDEDYQPTSPYNPVNYDGFY